MQKIFPISFIIVLLLSVCCSIFAKWDPNKKTTFEVINNLSGKYPGEYYVELEKIMPAGVKTYSSFHFLEPKKSPRPEKKTTAQITIKAIDVKHDKKKGVKEGAKVKFYFVVTRWIKDKPAPKHELKKSEKCIVYPLSTTPTLENCLERHGVSFLADVCRHELQGLFFKFKNVGKACKYLSIKPIDDYNVVLNFNGNPSF